MAGPIAGRAFVREVEDALAQLGVSGGGGGGFYFGGFGDDNLAFQGFGSFAEWPVGTVPTGMTTITAVRYQRNEEASGAGAGTIGILVNGVSQAATQVVLPDSPHSQASVTGLSISVSAGDRITAELVSGAPSTGIPYTYVEGS